MTGLINFHTTLGRYKEGFFYNRYKLPIHNIIMVITVK